MGPAARALGGIDVGWLVGLIVAGGSYWILSRSLDIAAEVEAIQASEAALRVHSGGRLGAGSRQA